MHLTCTLQGPNFHLFCSMTAVFQLQPNALHTPTPAYTCMHHQIKFSVGDMTLRVSNPTSSLIHHPHPNPRLPSPDLLYDKRFLSYRLILKQSTPKTLTFSRLKVPICIPHTNKRPRGLGALLGHLIARQEKVKFKCLLGMKRLGK